MFIVLSTMVLLFILFLFIYPKLQADGDAYIIDFRNRSINGLNEGAYVKYQGVNIGNVKAIRVDTEDLRSILVKVELKKGFPVMDNMRASLQYAGITGLKFIEIEVGKGKAKRLEPGSKIMVGRGIGDTAEDIVKNIDTAIMNINSLIGSENKQKVGSALENIQKSTGIVQSVLGKKRGSVSNSLDNIERATAGINRSIEEMNRFTVNLNRLTDRMKLDKLTANMDGMVQNISARFSDQELGKVLKNIDKLVQSAHVSIKKLDRSIGQMENDFRKSMAYLRESLDNITKFTRDIAEDPTSLLIRKRGSRRRK